MGRSHGPSYLKDKLFHAMAASVDACGTFIAFSVHQTPTAMKPALLLTTMLTLAGTAAHAGSDQPAKDDFGTIHQILRKSGEPSLLVGNTRYVLVNDRFEDGLSRKEARREGRYIKRIDPSDAGWLVQILSLDGTVLLETSSLDPWGNVLHGDCTYYDVNGRLRAQGRYLNGLKTGTWIRFDGRGQRLADKFYYGEDWDAMQVRVGVSSLARSQDRDRISEF